MNTDIRFLPFLLLIGLFGSEGLVCHRCQGDPEKCERSAATEICQSFPRDRNSSQICASYYYWHNGKANVQKMCKSRQSCMDDAAQKDNACGDHDGKDKPCRCCCDKNNCNRLKKRCIVDSFCESPKRPKNGLLHCERPLKQGSACAFSCSNGYDLLGMKISRCILDRRTGRLKWSNVGQTCTRTVRCYPELKSLKNGITKCHNFKLRQDKADFNYLFSICTFSCNPGYHLQGASTAMCLKTREWSAVTPQCLPKLCGVFSRKSNWKVACTNGRFIGSVCAFKCKSGYRMLGPNITKCIGDRKDRNLQEWTMDPPRCVRIECQPKQRHPINGKVICSNMNYENSVCNFTCNVGYDLDNTLRRSSETKCVANDTNGLANWTNPSATCSRVFCDPKLQLENGKIECSAANFFDSECKFECNAGFDLDDTNLPFVVSTCQDDQDGNKRGIWSIVPPPTCSPVTCQPPHIDPINGKVMCSNGNQLGSSCVFRCNTFYDLEGTSNFTVTSKCVDSNKADALGMWTSKAPSCSIIKCPPLRELDNGAVHCTAGNFLRSNCSFTCNKDYELSIEKQSICEESRTGDNVGKWSLLPPTCKRLYCQAQYYDETKMNRKCNVADTKNFAVGSVCSYTCSKKGFHLLENSRLGNVGNRERYEVECLSTKKWNRKPPNCKPITCKRLPRLEHGYKPDCSRGNLYLSECTFRCEDKYALSHENNIMCLNDDTNNEGYGKWSHEPPHCIKNECEAFSQRQYGTINYTNQQKIGSFVRLNCVTGYTIKYYNESECLPVDKDHAVPYWSRTESVCCVRCLLNKKMRLIIAIDKTVAQSQQEWEIIVTWYTYVLEFLFTNGYDINLSYVVHDTQIVKENSVRLKTSEQVHETRKQLYRIPYGGEETSIKQVVEYVKSQMLDGRNGEEKFLILIRSLNAYDNGNLDIIEQMNSLREESINIIALQFKTRDINSNIEELAIITGSRENAIFLDGDSNLWEVGKTLTEISRKLACAKAIQSSPCAE